jgi:hypothetical protein
MNDTRNIPTADERGVPIEPGCRAKLRRSTTPVIVKAARPPAIVTILRAFSARSQGDSRGEGCPDASRSVTAAATADTQSNATTGHIAREDIHPGQIGMIVGKSPRGRQGTAGGSNLSRGRQCRLAARERVGLRQACYRSGGFQRSRIFPWPRRIGESLHGVREQPRMAQ